MSFADKWFAWQNALDRGENPEQAEQELTAEIDGIVTAIQQRPKEDDEEN